MEQGKADRKDLGIILQARIGSLRLPGKILKRIGNKTLLDHIIFRLGFLKHQAIIVLATTCSPKDDVVERYCKSKNIYCFRGNDENVLERYYFCAKEYGFKSIVRLTADNPFVDIEELDNLIELYYQNGLDYASSYRSLPVGVGAEIFTFDALEKSYLNGKAAHHLEHVDEYILENIDQFHTDSLKISGDKNRPDIRLTIDTEADYKVACYIVKNAPGEYVTTQDAIRLINDFSE
jgi:spore coat polysaccharide biosynthesis protein SpsF